MSDVRKFLESNAEEEEKKEEIPTFELVVKQGSSVQDILQNISNALNVRMVLNVDEDGDVYHVDTLEPGGHPNTATTSVTPAALYLLQLAQSKGLVFSDYKLHNLLYYAQGWHLAVSGECLFDEELNASMHGAKQEDLWHTITPDQIEALNYKTLPDDARKSLHLVFESYGHFSDKALMNRVCGTPPWLAAINNSANHVISTEMMMEYFHDISTKVALVPDNRSIN